MSHGLFGEWKQPDGSIIATFHAISVSSLDTDDILPEGIRFKLVRDGKVTDQIVTTNTVYGRVLIMEAERLRILGELKPGMGWTALKVRPRIIDGSQPLLCIVDMNLECSGKIIKHAKGCSDPICVDICAGIGGWHYGCKPFGIRPTVSVELNEEVAEILRYNHQLQVFSPEKFAEGSFNELALWMGTGIVVNGDFCDEVFWEHLSCRGVSVFLASLPCPPWSRLTGAQGLVDSPGSTVSTFRFHDECL